MKKYFICLANSFKYNGRCLAGIEITIKGAKYTIVRKEDGTPKWIRPVARRGHGELHPFETKDMNILDIIEVEIEKNCSKDAHSENVFYSSLEKCGAIKQETINLNNLCDTTHDLLFFNDGKSVATSIFKQNDFSLMFIHVSDCSFFDDGNERLRASFSYNGIEYNLPVTDPIFIDYAKNKGPEYLNPFDNYYFTVSLGEELEGWHYKLIAGVITDSMKINN